MLLVLGMVALMIPPLYRVFISIYVTTIPKRKYKRVLKINRALNHFFDPKKIIRAPLPWKGDK